MENHRKPNNAVMFTVYLLKEQYNSNFPKKTFGIKNNEFVKGNTIEEAIVNTLRRIIIEAEEGCSLEIRKKYSLQTSDYTIVIHHLSSPRAILCNIKFAGTKEFYFIIKKRYINNKIKTIATNKLPS